MEKLKVVITLAKRVRSRGRDRGLERFDADCGIARKEEKNFFFLISGEEKLVYKDLFGFYLGIVIGNGIGRKRWSKHVSNQRLGKKHVFPNILMKKKIFQFFFF